MMAGGGGWDRSGDFADLLPKSSFHGGESTVGVDLIVSTAMSGKPKERLLRLICRCADIFQRSACEIHFEVDHVYQDWYR